MKSFIAFAVAFLAAGTVATSQIKTGGESSGGGELPVSSEPISEPVDDKGDAVAYNPCTEGWHHAARGAHKTACYPPNWFHMDQGEANKTGYRPPKYVHNSTEKTMTDGTTVLPTTYTPPLDHVDRGADKTKYQIDTTKFKHASVDGPCKTYYFPRNYVHITDGLNKTCYYPLSKTNGNQFDPVSYQAAGYELSQNLPNPATHLVEITFSIPVNEFVSIELFDERGAFVRSVLKEEQTSGKHSVKFDVSDIPSGTYFYTMQSGVSTISKRMIVVH